MKHWSHGQLGQLFETVTGSTPPKSKKQYYGDDVPLVKPPELQNGPLQTAEDSLSDEGAAVARVLPPKSILVSCIGNLGKIGMNTVPVAFNQQINAIKPDYDKALPEFIFYLTLSPSFSEQLHSLASGTTVPIVNKSKFNSIRIALPPLPEQKRIVAILDEAFEGIDAAVANTEKNLANARELFESYLNAVFTQKGDGWVETTIGEQITLQRGFDITKKQQRPGKVPVVSSGGIKSHHDTSMAAGPGVVMGRKGTIGKVHFVQENYWPHDTTLWVKNFNGNHPKLAYYLFRSLDLARLDSGAANPALNRNIVHPIKISWPDVELQEEIIEQLDSVKAESESLETIYQKKLKTLAELKQSILQKAFAGKLTALPGKQIEEAMA
jgi:type I restriction enzyme S subunit